MPSQPDPPNQLPYMAPRPRRMLPLPPLHNPCPHLWAPALHPVRMNLRYPSSLLLRSWGPHLVPEKKGLSASRPRQPLQKGFLLEKRDMRHWRPALMPAKKLCVWQHLRVLPLDIPRHQRHWRRSMSVSTENVNDDSKNRWLPCRKRRRRRQYPRILLVNPLLQRNFEILVHQYVISRMVVPLRVFPHHPFGLVPLPRRHQRKPWGFPWRHNPLPLPWMLHLPPRKSHHPLLLRILVGKWQSPWIHRYPLVPQVVEAASGLTAVRENPLPSSWRMQ